MKMANRNDLDIYGILFFALGIFVETAGASQNIKY